MFSRLVPLVATAALGVALTPGVSAAAVADAPNTVYPQFDGVVRAIDRIGNTIYVGGTFNHATDANGTVKRKNVAAINATTGKLKAWNPRVKGVVRDLEAKPEGVYIVGKFTKVQGTPRSNVARVSLGKSAKLSSKFAPSIDGAVKAIDATKKTVYLAGSFYKVDKTTRRGGAAFSRSSGKIRAWAPDIRGGAVLDLDAKKTGVYLGGSFTIANRNPNLERLALVTRKSGKTKQAFLPVVADPVERIVVHGSTVYAAEGGPNGGGVLAVDRSTGRTSWERRFDGDVVGLMKYRGELVVGGHFTYICNSAEQTANGGCVDGSTKRDRGASLSYDGKLTAWDPQGNGVLGFATFAKQAAGGALLVGGDFTRVGDGAVPTRAFAEFTGLS